MRVHILDENVMIWLKMRAFRVYSFELASTRVHILDEKLDSRRGIRADSHIRRSEAGWNQNETGLYKSAGADACTSKTAW